MGDTDADREPAFGPAPAGCDAASNALGQRPGIVGIETIGDNDEFLAAEAVGEIRHANRRDHVEHDTLQNSVTSSVTEPIIEVLEVIDIDEQQSEVPACGGGMLDGTASVHLERLAVESTSKRIATGTRQQIFVAL